jgi:type I restriction enzyme M protein
VEEDDEPFEEKMKRLTSDLEKQFAESARLESQIKHNFNALLQDTSEETRSINTKEQGGAI